MLARQVMLKVRRKEASWFCVQATKATSREALAHTTAIDWQSKVVEQEVPGWELFRRPGAHLTLSRTS